jgi:hypothetical protein
MLQIILYLELLKYKEKNMYKKYKAKYFININYNISYLTVKSIQKFSKILDPCYWKI